jgi:prevent-host-death family protein
MAEKYVNVFELKADFSRYLKRVQSGKSVTIALRNRPVAELRPLRQVSAKKLVFGVLKNRFNVPDDFDAPLASFEDDYYGGE